MIKGIRSVLAVGVLALGFGVIGANAGEQRAEIAFRMTDPRIAESSGLVTSLRETDRVWTNNDSGDSARIFAVNTDDGITSAVLDLTGAPARDWEAMTACRGADGTPALWMGDIGDNLGAWRTYRLLRVVEPRQVGSGPIPWTRYDVRYADGKARDAETMLCHPRTGRLYLVSKSQTADAAVWVGPQRMVPNAMNVFTRVADAPPVVTDGTFTADGTHVILRGYRQAWVLDATWKVIATFTPPGQLQSETAALTADGRSVLFGSEGVGAAVWRVHLPADLRELQGTGEDLTATQPTPTSGGLPRTPDRSTDPIARVSQPTAGGAKGSAGIPGIDGAWVALISVLGAAALALVLIARRD